MLPKFSHEHPDWVLPRSIGPTMSESDVFTYLGVDIDVEHQRLEAHYQIGEERFSETVVLPGTDFTRPGIREAAEIYALFAGISYFKTRAPHRIDLGPFTTTAHERAFLLRFFQAGLGEFAFENSLDLSTLEITGPERAVAPVETSCAVEHVLIAFGGGIDSIVTVSELSPLAQRAALFVAERPGARFEAIEKSAALTHLPVMRGERVLDEKVLASTKHGYLNGHVPVTGILSALAVLTGVASGYGAIAFSNERSASIATRSTPQGEVNHQWSKGSEFEEGFRTFLEGRLSGITYFSWLRNRSELSIAKIFAGLPQFHDTFRSCNRAFHQDPSKRLDTWCGVCDKCLFVDLALAPFLDADALRAIFAGSEPLENPALEQQLKVLIGTSSEGRPFECVGDEAECHEALLATAHRPDRQANQMIQSNASNLAPTQSQTDDPLPPSIPENYATRHRLG